MICHRAKAAIRFHLLQKPRPECGEWRVFGTVGGPAQVISPVALHGQIQRGHKAACCQILGNQEIRDQPDPQPRGSCGCKGCELVEQHPLHMGVINVMVPQPKFPGIGAAGQVQQWRRAHISRSAKAVMIAQPRRAHRAHRFMTQEHQFRPRPVICSEMYRCINSFVLEIEACQPRDQVDRDL